MEIYKNKASGQYFIYICETGDEEALLVTPNAEIKSLSISLFANPEDHPEAHLLEEKIVTAEQIQRFHVYSKDRIDDIRENLKHYFDQLSPVEKASFIKMLQEIVE